LSLLPLAVASIDAFPVVVATVQFVQNTLATFLSRTPNLRQRVTPFDRFDHKLITEPMAVAEPWFTGTCLVLPAATAKQRMQAVLICKRVDRLRAL
jgi:hypothetical protein